MLKLFYIKSEIMIFEDLGLSGKTIKAIHGQGYTEPTDVQKKAIPKIIDGVNLVVRSQTGTGKTAAFGIGIVERIAKGLTSKAIVLVPTRELAVQVSKELQELGDRHRLVTCAVFGGQKITIQLRELRNKYDILVATPGRLQDLCRRRKVNLSKFDLIVLDEADHMLDIGFQKEVLEILSTLPPNRLTLLFSATIDKRIEGIISRHVPNSEYIEIGEMKTLAAINEEERNVPYADKVSELHRILDEYRGVKTIIFVRTKRGVIKIKEKLRRRKLEGVNMLQGDMEQNKRSRVISGFKEGAITVLVATNVAARGLHIDDVGLIINFDKAENKETHLHRIGRTGRMGAEGKVINLISPDEPPRRTSRGGRRSEDRGVSQRSNRRPRRSNQGSHSGSGQFRNRSSGYDSESQTQYSSNEGGFRSKRRSSGRRSGSEQEGAYRSSRHKPYSDSSSGRNSRSKRNSNAEFGNESNSRFDRTNKRGKSKNGGRYASDRPSSKRFSGSKSRRPRR